MNNQKLPKKTIEDHVNHGSPEIQTLFRVLELKIKRMAENINEYPTRPYIGFNLFKRDTLFVEVHIQKEKISLHLRPINYVSTKLIVNKKPDSHKWKLNRTVDILPNMDVTFVMELIEQSYKDIL
jgi:predicted transport protein